MRKIFYSKIILIFGLLPALLLAFPNQTFAQSDYQAQRLQQSSAGIPEVTIGGIADYWVKFKNTGQMYWSGTGTQALTLRTVSGMKGKFYHPTWYDNNAPNRINSASTIDSQGEIVFSFTLLAPSQPGLYWEKLNLFAGNTLIPGGEIEIALKVISGSSSITPTPTPVPTPTPTPVPTPTPTPTTGTFWQSIPSNITIASQSLFQNTSDKGPDIRVGLLYVEEKEKKDYLPFKISTLDKKAYQLLDQNNKLLIRVSDGGILEVDFDFKLKRYFILDDKGKRLMMLDSFVKFQGNDSTIFKIQSWQNGPFWDGGENDNEFRDSMEIQYNASTQRLWLINQLPMEDYLKGLGEAGDSSPIEFLKAQAIAARTYATSRYISPKYTNTPDGDSLFTVRSTQADQVYRGYQRELRMTNTLTALTATQGVVATYQNSPISAYYFAQSDGRTRSSHEAAMTAAPVDYLISKIDPPGAGKTLLGHGVGMPQRSAIVAANQGANFSQILKYYYTGIDLTKIY